LPSSLYGNTATALWNDPSYINWGCKKANLAANLVHNSYYIHYYFSKSKSNDERGYNVLRPLNYFLYIRDQVSVYRSIHLWCHLQICSTICLRPGCFLILLEFLEHLPFQQLLSGVSHLLLHLNMDYTWFGYYKPNWGY
jgi:hypothetical protein